MLGPIFTFSEIHLESPSFKQNVDLNINESIERAACLAEFYNGYFFS